MGAHDTDEVGVAGGDDVVGEVEGLDAPDRGDRHVDGVADGAGDAAEQAFGSRGGRPVSHPRLESVVVADHDADVVDLGFEGGGDVGGVAGGETAGDKVVATEADAEHPVVAEGFANGPQHAARQLEAALGVAAELVVAPVGQRGEERGEQEAVGHADLDAVEVAAAAAVGGGRVVVDDAGELGGGGGHGDLSGDLGQVEGGADDLDALVLGRPRVRELGEHAPALGVHRLREAPVAGHDRLVDVPQADVGPLNRGRDRCGARDLHGDAGLGSLPVVGDVAVGDAAALGEPGLVGGQVDAAAQGDRPDANLLVKTPLRHVRLRRGD